MDRPTTRTDADARITRIDLHGAEPAAFLPPSRQAILDLGLAALELGPILITGDAGIGKTWTVGRLARLAPGRRWAAIDLTPHDGPADLYRQIARGLGMAPAGRPTRLDIADELAERAADGERHALVIDEAHNLAPAVWEEVRILANRLGQGDGFAHLVLVGQTALVRRFATRSLAAIEARLAAHLHLRPLDLAEAGDWLALRHPGLAWSADELEAVHRDSGGNPARLLRRSAAISARSAPARVAPASIPAERPAAPAPAMGTALDGSGPAAMIAGRVAAAPAHRPPLHVEENAIEVGWSTDEVPPAADDEEQDESAGSIGLAQRPDDSDQAVHDHYAALQAWREWASNQEKRTPPPRSDRDLADEIDEAAAAEADDRDVPALPERTSVRAEGHQHFAPFGQLFTRLTPAREPESPRS